MTRKNKDKANKTKKTNNTQSRTSETKAPAAVGTRVKGATQPRIENRSDGSCVITHREYCFDIAGEAADVSGNAVVEAVNPQRNTVFTWLSAIATRFEMYRFKKLKFLYKPSCGTATDGWAVMGFDFDVYDQPEGAVTAANTPSKAVMLAWRYSQKAAPWQPMELDVTKDARLSTMRYCDNASRGDARLDQLGNVVFRAYTSGTTTIGELFVEYTIEFRQPSYKVPPALYATFDNSSPSSVSDWFTNATKTGNALIEKVPGSANKLLVKEVGKFLINSLVQASAGIGGAPTISGSTPTYSPLADYTLTSLFSNDSTGGQNNVRIAELDVRTPPVLLTWSNMAGSNLINNVRFATYD